ncbi:MAG: hypothetical protein JWR07_5684 [Nevskia sp.]|jgi:type VI secretion system protein ImpK|nr:hypothetical protein [Nevskia sp.]
MEALSWAADPNPLSALFREAYGRFCALAGPTRASQTAPRAVSPAVARMAADSMATALGDLCNQLRRDAGQNLRQSAPDQADALLYAFCAVVDERLLNSQWAGLSVWGEHLLERAEFTTQLAGARLFDRIGAATRAPRSRQGLEIAGLYLDCLNLGFQGRYREQDHGLAELQALREDLFSFVYARKAQLDRPGFALAEPVDLHLLTTEPAQLSLGEQYRWYVVPLGALLLPLLVSSGLWLWLRYQPHNVISQILPP